MSNHNLHPLSHTHTHTHTHTRTHLMQKVVLFPGMHHSSPVLPHGRDDLQYIHLSRLLQLLHPNISTDEYPCPTDTSTRGGSVYYYSRPGTYSLYYCQPWQVPHALLSNLQCTTVGPGRSLICFLACRMKLSAGCVVTGTPWSGHDVNQK